MGRKATATGSGKDHPYKLLFSHPEMVRDLLLTFVREDWVSQLDFSTLEKLNTQFVTEDLRDRESDIIWRVRWGERWLFVYLLIEFQSSPDRFMAVRIMTYLGLLYQDLIRTKKVGPGEKLPPVLPLVLFNGRGPWTSPIDVADLIETVPGGLERYRPNLRYLLIDETAYKAEDLIPHQNPVAALFRLESCRDVEEVRAVLADLVAWLKSPKQTRLRRDFTVWIARTFLPGRAPGASIPEFNDLQEVDAMLAETVIDWTIKWKREGLEEGLKKGFEKGLERGREEGLTEGQAALIQAMLARGCSQADIARLTGLSESEIQRLAAVPKSIPWKVEEPAAPYHAPAKKPARKKLTKAAKNR